MSDINTIIDQLAEIDSASAKIMQETQVAKTQYSEMITEKKHEFDAMLDSEIEAELKEYRKAILKENEELIEQCKKDCEKTIKALDQSYATNGSGWVDEIFNHIIKG